MNTSHELADSRVFNCIDPLPHDVNQKMLKEWVDHVNELAYSYQTLSALPTYPFWSTVLYNPHFILSYDSALEYIPRGHSLDRFHLIYRWNSDAQKAVQFLQFQILVLYCRIHVYPCSIDKQLTKDEWLDYTQNRGVMPLTRAANAWILFPQKTDLFVKILFNLSKHVLNSRQLIRDLAHEHKNIHEHFDSAVCQLYEKFNHMTGPQQIRAAGLILKFLYLVADEILTSLLALEILSGASLTKETYHFITKIPQLLENISKTLPVGVLMDVAAILPGWPMRTILQLNAQIQQGSVKLFKRGLFFCEPKDRLKIIDTAIRCERFTFLAHEFDAFSCILREISADERSRIEKCINTAVKNQQENVVKKVEDHGLCQSLGKIDTLPSHHRDAFRKVKDAFPNMTPQYLHLCLRHFDYNAQQAIESMLSIDHKMPIDLRRMQYHARISNSDFLPTLPTLSFHDIDMLDKAVKSSKSVSQVQEVKQDYKNNVFKGLFSMAPNTVKTSVSHETSLYENSSNSLTDIINEIRGTLERRKQRELKKDTREIKAQEGPKGERLVPMNEAKRYAGISKFSVQDIDKLAVRPTYETFKYETRFEEDEMYDDEYDDGYEQREFQIEPLNQPLSDEESEDEQQKEESIAAKCLPGGRGGGQRGRSRGGSNNQKEKVVGQKVQKEGQQSSSGGSKADYTGGRQRQMKERHKNQHRQRGADKKLRGGMF